MFRCMSVPNVCERDRHDVQCLLWFGSCLWDCTMSAPQVRSEPKPPFPKLNLAPPVWTPLDLADTGHPPVQGDAPPPCSFGGFAVCRGVYDDTETKRKDHACFNRCGAFDTLGVRRGLRTERQPDVDDHESDGRGGGNSRGATGYSSRAGRARHTFFIAIDAIDAVDTVDTVDSGSSLCVPARWRRSGDGRSRPVRSINAILRHDDPLDGDRHEQ
jgi:hypothetical protein